MNEFDRLDSEMRDSLRRRKSGEPEQSLAEAENAVVPAAWVAEAKALGLKKNRLKCPHCGRGITPFKKPVKAQMYWNLLWLIFALVSFSLSFLFKAVFIQFLVLTVIFSLKLMVNQRAMRTQLLIYKALKEGEEQEQKSLVRH
jgi:hypothetical protein